MSQPLKWALATVGGIVALLLAGVLFIALTFDPNAYKPLAVQAMQERYQRTLAIPGRIDLAFWPRLGAQLGEVTLSERGKPGERFASLKSARVSLALWPLLKGEVQLDRIEVNGLDARLVRFKDGTFNFDDLLGPAQPAGGASAPPAASTAPLKLDIAGLALTDASLAYEDQKAPRRVQLAVLNLQTGRFAPGVPMPLELKTQLRSDSPKLEGALAAKTQLQFTASPAKPLARVVAEALAIDLDGKLDAIAVKARVGGTVNADLEAGKLDAKLGGQLDESKFTLTLRMPRLSPAAYTFDADIDRLNLDRYRAGGTPTGTTGGAGAAAAEKPLDLSALRDLEATGQVRVGALQVMNLKATALRSGVRASGGRLTLQPLSAELYQGRLNGSASIAATSPARATLQHNLEGIAIGPLLKDLTGNDALQGRGNLALDITTTGTTVTAMTQALSGSARLALKDGAVRGANVAQIVRQAKALAAAARGKEGPGGTAAKGEATDFSELTASFRIAAGVARNEDLNAKSPLLRLAGRGDVDLGASRLDYTVRATIVPTLEGQGGAELQALRGQTVPVRLTGPFSAIDWRIDFGAMAKEAAEGKLEQKKEELKDQARRRLDDKLRGLLRK